MFNMSFQNLTCPASFEPILPTFNLPFPMINLPYQCSTSPANIFTELYTFL